MFERILVPLDGSPLAEKILDQTRPVMARTGSEVLLLVSVWVEAAAMTPTTLGNVIDQAEEKAKEYLAPLAEQLAEDGINARPLVRIGPAPETILEVAAEEKVSLIAMSTHGRSGLKRWLLGSVAERVLRTSRVPLLLLRSFVGGPDGKPTPSPGTWSPERILVPIDGSRASLRIVSRVSGISELAGGSIDVLRIVEPPHDHGRTSRAQGQLDRQLEKFETADVPVTGHLRHSGSAAEGILSFARQNDSGLIAMMTHGRSGIPRWMMGSVTEEVLRRSTLPILVMRQPSRPSDEWSVSDVSISMAEVVEELS